MKKTILIAFVMCLQLAGFCQMDSMLTKRLIGYIQAIHELNTEKIIAFIYPPFFSIVSKKQFQEGLKLKTDMFTLQLSGLTIDSTGPTFRFQNGFYAKIAATAVYLMNLDFTNKTAAKKKELVNDPMLLESMHNRYHAEKVITDSLNNILIYIKGKIVAVNDQHVKQWSFVIFQEGDLLINKLFSKELLTKLAAF
jgi:hypothetical protein